MRSLYQMIAQIVHNRYEALNSRAKHFFLNRKYHFTVDVGVSGVRWDTKFETAIDL